MNSREEKIGYRLGAPRPEKKIEPYYPYVYPEESRVNPIWNTGEIVVIEMKDGNYTLGKNYIYTNPEDEREYYVTCRIKVDENNKPYIDVYEGLSDFSEETCKTEMRVWNTKQQTGNIVCGQKVLTTIDDMIEKDESVFEFVGKCVEEDRQKYFESMIRSVDLSRHGLIILLKYVESAKQHGEKFGRYMFNKKIKAIDLSEIEKELDEESLDK